MKLPERWTPEVVAERRAERRREFRMIAMRALVGVAVMGGLAWGLGDSWLWCGFAVWTVGAAVFGAIFWRLEMAIRYHENGLVRIDSEVSDETTE